MYKKKEEKLTLDKIKQTCDDMKPDLYESISYENQRSNVDNAKKTAVKQFMDYDNFKQMVLGANIKPMKSTEVAQMLNKQNARGTMNYEAAMADIARGSVESEANTEAIHQKFKDLSLVDIPALPANFREFRKAYEKLLEERRASEEKSDFLTAAKRGFDYMKSIPLANYPKIFGVEFDAQYLVKLITTFESLNKAESLQADDLVWILGLLKEISKISGYAFNVLTFLSKKEKQQIQDFFQAVETKLTVSDVDSSSTTSTLLVETKKIYTSK